MTLPGVGILILTKGTGGQVEPRLGAEAAFLTALPLEGGVGALSSTMTARVFLAFTPVLRGLGLSLAEEETSWSISLSTFDSKSSSGTGARVKEGGLRKEGKGLVN